MKILKEYENTRLFATRGSPALFLFMNVEDDLPETEVVGEGVLVLGENGQHCLAPAHTGQHLAQDTMY